MDLYFVYSAGGGAGDWGGINRVFKKDMPNYFKDHLLIKFGDLFFNHRDSPTIIKVKQWKEVDNARQWLVENTHDTSLLKTDNLIMDVGTTKIVSYITAHDTLVSDDSIVERFNNIIISNKILDKYCCLILNSNISNSVTFDIPNLFKVRSQIGIVSRHVYGMSCRDLVIKHSARYANYIYEHTGKNADKLLTFVSACWSENEINKYFSYLNYKPTKLGVGALSDYPSSRIAYKYADLDRILHFSNFKRVHFLGCGGIVRTNELKRILGDNSNFSVDVTTPYNRAIDGSVNGKSKSAYIDCNDPRKLIRISPLTCQQILKMHSCAEYISNFSTSEMKNILDGIIKHQSNNSDQSTYDNRARLVIHNYCAYRFNAGCLSQK